jgi:uncharacterized membrane protein YdjX (TVP38/TMEM64 family)
MQRVFQLLRNNKKQSLWLAVFALMPFISGSALVYLALKYAAFLNSMSSVQWIGVFIVLAFPVAFSLIANTLAGLLAGYFLGWPGLAGMILSFSLANLIGYSLGRLTGRGLLDEVCRIWPGMEQIFARFRARPVSLVFSLRLMPAPPFAVGSLVLAWLKLPFTTIFWGSMLGMVPRMALVVWLGHLAGDVNRLISDSEAGSPVSFMLSVFAGLGFLFLYIRFFRKSA